MEFEPVPPRFYRLPLAWQALAILAGAAAMAVASQVEVQIGPVPLTFQTLMVFLLAGAMGRRSALSIALWLLAAGLGAPVLAGGVGGWPELMGPTQGYLVGMVLGAALAGRIAERVRQVHSLVAAFVYGHGIVLLFGFFGLLRIYPPEDALNYGVFPFVVTALIKVAAATALVYALAQTLSRRAAA